MKVAFDAEIMGGNRKGIAKSIAFLYAACARIDPGWELHGFHKRTITPGLSPGFVSHRPLSFIRRGHWRPLVLPLAMRALRPEVAHFPFNGEVPPMMGNLPVVSTLHDILPLQVPGYFRDPGGEKERFRLRTTRDLSRSHLVVTVSDFSRRSIQSEFPDAAQVVVIPNAPTIEAPRRRSALHPSAGGNPYLLYCGGYEHRKGLVPLLRAFLDSARGNRVSCRLLMVGDPAPLSSRLLALLEEGRRLGLVEELGFVSEGHLAELYRSALALVYPSKWEGFGLPPLEAMSLGCPVVAAPFSSLPEVCGDAVLWADPDDPRAFGEALEAVANRPSLRADLAARGVARASLFSWERSARLFLECLERARALAGLRRSGNGGRA